MVATFRGSETALCVVLPLNAVRFATVATDLQGSLNSGDVIPFNVAGFHGVTGRTKSSPPKFQSAAWRVSSRRL